MSEPCILLPRGLLRITGEDARPFLQGLISNDINKVTETTPIYAALLTPQGKFLFDFFIIQHGDALLLDTEKSRLPDLLKRLTQYRLRSKVNFEDVSDQYTVYALLSASSSGLPKGSIAYKDPRHADLGLRIIAPSNSIQPSASFETYEKHRLGLGIPDGSRDIEVDRGILLEHGFEELHGVDFLKGCYVGQEVTARSKHIAELKKGLYIVHGKGELPSFNTPVMSGPAEIGKMRSSLGNLGLALLRGDDVKKAKESNTPLISGGMELTATLPQWKK